MILKKILVDWILSHPGDMIEGVANEAFDDMGEIGVFIKLYLCSSYFTHLSSCQFTLAIISNILKFLIINFAHLSKNLPLNATENWVLELGNRMACILLF